MNTATEHGNKQIWKRLGIVGFAFFLLKGLVWLAVPVVMYLIGAAG
ncbi:MAG: hypothetical protein JJE42_18480 [Burkholderiales bacterium]|nr:hypothetical protein [Burkholderiales bacterium]